MSHDRLLPTWRDRRASLQISYMLSRPDRGDRGQIQTRKSKE